MHREGLFRVPGDQTVLQLCPRRFRGDHGCSKIVLDGGESADSDSSLLSADDIGLHLPTSCAERNEKSGGGDRGGAVVESAVVVVSDVDVVAQVRIVCLVSL